MRARSNTSAAPNFHRLVVGYRGFFYFDHLEYAKILYETDWGQASQEEKEQIRLYQVELDESETQRLDMRLLRSIMWERDDLGAVLDSACGTFPANSQINPFGRF